MRNDKALILVVDDAELNRSFLRDMLEDDYRILEAGDGDEALRLLEQRHEEIALLLLDVIMPRKDGLDVLREMAKMGWINTIPTVIISGETAPDRIAKGYELGAIDYISRPFDSDIVKRRVQNTTMLYAKQRTLQHMAEQQLELREQDNTLLADVLSSIVEFRGGEAGAHAMHMRRLTQQLLETLGGLYPEYALKPEEITEIALAAALHDVGKITIPEAILNKPGKLTAEEFKQMEMHAVAGAQLLERITMGKDSIMLFYARMICRWHHEKWDGHGYPDGLRGNQIPLCAQVVGLADVYDALTSKRVYRSAYSHQDAIHMIQDGQCGAFNPHLLEAMRMDADYIHNGLLEDEKKPLPNKLLPMLERREEKLSDRTIFLLEQERTKYQFLAALACDVMFDYDAITDTVKFIGEDAKYMGLPPAILQWSKKSSVQTLLKPEQHAELREKVKHTTAKEPVLQEQYLFYLPTNVQRWYELTARTLWTNDSPPTLTGCIGKLTDIHLQKMESSRLRTLAEHDSLTGMYNRAAAEYRISKLLNTKPVPHGALIFFDVDCFKQVNDACGHAFGDALLQHIARTVQAHIRHTDIAARVGGDEFIIYLQNTENEEAAVRQAKRIQVAFREVWNGFHFSVSMGCALFPRDAVNYAELLRCADDALYSSKRGGRDRLTMYQKKRVKPGPCSCLSPAESENMAQERETDEET